jgi:glycosyltransferase involved in cell wall biosynthesis
LKANRKQNEIDFVFPLSSQDRTYSKKEIDYAEKSWSNFEGQSESMLRGFFVGSLNDAFDFQPFINAAKKFPIFLIIAGDGPRLDTLRKETQNIPNIIFPGRISSVEALVLSSNSDFSLAPLVSRSDFEMSIPNKFYDAMQLGKPMITSLEGPARRMVERNNCGKFYKNEDELNDLLSNLMQNSESLAQMSRNALFHYKNEFSFSKVYGGAVQKLMDLLAKHP